MKKNTDFRFCVNILPAVSRTFALNINRLAGNSRRAVTVGYLLFRIADTFEDTLKLAEAEKIKNLRGFARIFTDGANAAERVRAYRKLDTSFEAGTPEGGLLENGGRVLRAYCSLPAVYRRITDPLIAEAAGGMAEYQERKHSSRKRIFQLNDAADLELYCYYVAGTVGKMLTGIFSLRKKIAPAAGELAKRQNDFGLALQLTNIAKDFEKDLGRGWFYIPKTFIRLPAGGKLTDSDRKKIICRLVPAIVPRLDATLKYIGLMPEAERDVRLFCIIPFVLAYGTLRKIRLEGVNKLTREEVFAALNRSEVFASVQKKLEKDYVQARHLLVR